MTIREQHNDARRVLALDDVFDELPTTSHQLAEVVAVLLMRGVDAVANVEVDENKVTVYMAHTDDKFVVSVGTVVQPVETTNRFVCETCGRLRTMREVALGTCHVCGGNQL